MLYQNLFELPVEMPLSQDQLFVSQTVAHDAKSAKKHVAKKRGETAQILHESVQILYESMSV